MSATDNTRPLEVIEDDPSALHIPRNSGSHSMVITGRANSANGSSKPNRMVLHRQGRGLIKTMLRKARRELDTDEIDIPPCPAERRSLGWRAALA
jgi:hypothetical protein